MDKRDLECHTSLFGCVKNAIRTRIEKIRAEYFLVNWGLMSCS